MTIENQNNILAFPNSPLSKNRTDFLQRMNNWLLRSYGISIEYFEAFELADELIRALTVFSSHREDHRLSLPVRLEQKIIGSLRVTLPPQLTEEKMEQASELIHCIVLPYLEHLKRAQDLRAKEVRLSAPTVPIHQAFLPLEHTSASPSLLPKPVFIQSADAEAIRRKALDLHDKSGNLIFLPFDDLDAETRMNAKSLLELTHTTIFVAALAEKRREDVAAVMGILTSQAEGLPFFIFGSSASAEDVCRRLFLTEDESQIVTSRIVLLDR